MNSSRKIGIFGGTFNPVHNGHVRLAEIALSHLSLDELIVIPTNIPPHKSSVGIAGAEDRLNMLHLAFEKIEKVRISDIEVQSEGKSYSILTLEKIKKIYPNDELFLIVGGDMFLCFDSWKEYKKILSMCTVCTAPREIGELEKLSLYQSKLDPLKNSTLILDVPVLELSSTEIKIEIYDSEKIKNQVPCKVYDYIVKKGLYKND